jgi:hypothetical protein
MEIEMTQPATQPRPEGAANRWQDWLNLILAAWLFITSFFLVLDQPAHWNAWIVSVAVGVLAVWSAGVRGRWQEWINLILGAWLFISPWVYGFANGSAAAWDHWIIGALVFIVSIWSLNALRSATMAHGYR